MRSECFFSSKRASCGAFLFEGLGEKQNDESPPTCVGRIGVWHMGKAQSFSYLWEEYRAGKRPRAEKRPRAGKKKQDAPLAATLLGSSTRMLRPANHAGSSSSRASGTAVVLPAPRNKSKQKRRSCIQKNGKCDMWGNVGGVKTCRLACAGIYKCR